MFGGNIGTPIHLLNHAIQQLKCSNIYGNTVLNPMSNPISLNEYFFHFYLKIIAANRNSVHFALIVSILESFH